MGRSNEVAGREEGADRLGELCAAAVGCDARLADDPDTAADLFRSLSPQDRAVLLAVARRIAVIEDQQGASAAEAALVKVVDVLRNTRGVV